MDVNIPLGQLVLNGILTIPEEPIGIVLFAHGSGSSRFSKRNQYVSQVLNDGNIATLLFDLLTPQEEEVDQFTREHRFNISLLSARLAATTDWVAQQAITDQLAIGYFGSSTGGAAALCAAAQRAEVVRAVVSRGGRPDLADALLPEVKAPTLLIVGSQDEPVIQMNKEAMAKMNCHTELTIVDGATHLFEEPGKLEQVAHLARNWFVQYLD